MSNVIKGNFGKPKKEYKMPDPNDPSTWGSDSMVDVHQLMRDTIKNETIFQTHDIVSAFAGSFIGGRELFCCSGDIPKEIEHYEVTHVIPDGDYKINLTDHEGEHALLTIVAYGVGDEERVGINKLPTNLTVLEKSEIGYLAYAVQLEMKRRFKFIDLIHDGEKKTITVIPLYLANTRIEIHYGPGQNKSIWKPVYYKD